MRMLVLACSLVALTGCGAASDAVDAVEETRTVSLHGTWHSTSGDEHPASITVQQRGLSAKLTVALERHVCLAESTLEAELSLSGVKTTADIGGMHLELEGDPGLDEVIGNFEAIKNGPCPGQGGWLTVFRR